MKREWDTVLDILSKTFSMDPRLCNNENYVVFVISAMKRLQKVSPKASQAILQLIETIQKEIKTKSEKGVEITLFLANTAFGIGTKGYPIACKLYETLMSMDVKEAELGYIFTKCALEGDESGKLEKKLGDMTMDFDDEYKRLLLDETKLKIGSKKAGEEKKETASAKKKKHKKGKLPKNADPTNPPDPERWLPKWKRSKYRKQFKRYGKSRETQGEATATAPIGACKIFNTNSLVTGPSTATADVTKSKQKKK
jgi:signal recognition particle subunit SRP72